AAEISQKAYFKRGTVSHGADSAGNPRERCHGLFSAFRQQGKMCQCLFLYGGGRILLRCGKKNQIPAADRSGSYLPELFCQYRDPMRIFLKPIQDIPEKIINVRAVQMETEETAVAQPAFGQSIGQGRGAFR